MDLLLFDVDAEDLVALADGRRALHARGHPPEDGVAIVQAGLGRKRYIELAAVGVGAAVRHCQGAESVLPDGAELVRDGVAGVAGAVAKGVAALDDAGRWLPDDTVEDKAVVETGAGEEDEVVRR